MRRKVSDGVSAKDLPLKRYVYCYYLNNEPVYVGEGNSRRGWSNVDRHAYLIDNWYNLEIEILVENLESGSQARKIEAEFILDLRNKGFSLFNRQSSSCVKPILFEEMNYWFYLDDADGFKLKWKNKPKNSTIKVGDTINNSSKSTGYSSVIVNRTAYKCHRVVWCLYNKLDVDTDLYVDHIDNDKTNNHPSNLRLVTASDNNRNRRMDYHQKKLRVDNKYGYTGVYFLPERNFWHCRISINGVKYNYYFNINDETGTHEERIEKAKIKAVSKRKELENLVKEKHGADNN